MLPILLKGDLVGFVQQLRGVCAHVIDDKPRLKVYEADGLTAKKSLPAFVALPESISEVQGVVALCHREGVPVVARGAGTGLSGGAMPHPEGVLLSLAKFNRVLEIDVENRTARVEPGVTNLGISNAVRDLNLYYAPDPSSQMHHRWQYCGEFRGRALFKIRFNGEQCPGA